MKIVEQKFAKDVSDKTINQFEEMNDLFEKTQELIQKLEGKNGEPLISITTSSKNYTLSMKLNK